MMEAATWKLGDAATDSRQPALSEQTREGVGDLRGCSFEDRDLETGDQRDQRGAECASCRSGTAPAAAWVSTCRKD
jgi:hypothetical protein